MIERAPHSMPRVLPAACLISFGLALATFARIWMPDGGADHLLARFDLHVESNVAVLWSSLLLLMVAGHCLARALEHDLRDAVQRRGWQLIALVAVVLSADELAALHQRIGLAGETIGIGRWAALAPFGLLLIAVIVHALVLLRPRVDLRRFALLATGFGILLTVPLIEHLGDRYDFGPVLGPLRPQGEEVIELIAGLVLLAASLPGLDRSVATDLLDVATCTARHTERVSLLVAVLVLPAAAVAAATWTGDRGLPSNWLAMALSALGVLMTLSTPGPGARVAAACFALATLVMVEAGHLAPVPGVPPPFAINVRLAALAVALAAVLPLAASAARPATFGLILLTLALATQSTSPFAHYVVTPLIALAAMLVAAGALRHRTAGRTFAPLREAFGAAD